MRDPTANHPGTDFEGEWYRHGAVFKKLGLTHDAVHVIWHAFHKMDKEKKGYVNYYNFLMYYGTRMPWRGGATGRGWLAVCAGLPVAPASAVVLSVS